MGLLYKRISVLDSPFNPTASTLDDLNANQNSTVLDCDTTAGAIVINLPSINSLIYSSNGNAGGGATTFYIKGNIVAGANTVTINSDDADSICGSSSSEIGTVGSCFHVFIAGLNTWGLFVCSTTPPPTV